MRRKRSNSETKDDNESNKDDTAGPSFSRQQQQDGPQLQGSGARPPKSTKSTGANEDKLKRPRSAYIIFLQEYASNLQPCDNKQFGSRAGEAWRLLSAEEKIKYQTMCDRERLDYKLTKDDNANKQRRNAADAYYGDKTTTTTTTNKNKNYYDTEGGAVTSCTVLENFEQNPNLPPPPIPKSSYLHFFEDWKEIWRREHPEESKNAKMSTLSQLAGEEWRSMNAIQKQPWIDKVVKEKQIYTTWKLVKSSSFKSFLNLKESSNKEEEEEEKGGSKEEGDTENNNDGDGICRNAAAAARSDQPEQHQQQYGEKKRQRPAKETTNSRSSASSLKKDNVTNNYNSYDSILITTNNNSNSGNFSLPPLPPNKKRRGGSGQLPLPLPPISKYPRIDVDAFSLPFPPPLQVHQQHQQPASFFMNTAGSGMNRVPSYNSAIDAIPISTTNITPSHFIATNAVNPTHPPSAAACHHRMVPASTSAVLDPSPISNIALGIQNAYKGGTAVMVSAHNALVSFPPPSPPPPLSHHQGIVSVGTIAVMPSTVAVPMMVQTINNSQLQQHISPLNVQQQQAQHLQQPLLHNPHNPLPPPSIQQQQQQQQQAAAFELIDDKLMHAEAMVSIIENKINKQ